tara:strand:+ start:353 stop:574 length:222 start_codon:yes stop_codon:yes gene_type:complete
MSKNKKQYSKDSKGEELDVNGNPIDPNREYIGNKLKYQWLLQIHLFIKNLPLLYLKENHKVHRKRRKQSCLSF